MPHAQSQTDPNPYEDLYNQLIGALHFPDFDSFTEPNTWIRLIECAQLGNYRVKEYEHLLYRKLIAKLPLRHRHEAAKLHLKTLDGLIQYALSNTSQATNGPMLISDNNSDNLMECYPSNPLQNQSEIYTEKNCGVSNHAEQLENMTHTQQRTFEKNEQLRSTSCLNTSTTLIYLDDGSSVENGTEIPNTAQSKQSNSNVSENCTSMNSSRIEIIDLIHDDNIYLNNSKNSTLLAVKNHKRRTNRFQTLDGLSNRKRNSVQSVTSNRCNEENDGNSSRIHVSPQVALNEVQLVPSTVFRDISDERVVIEYTNKQFHCPFNKQDAQTSSWNEMEKHINVNHERVNEVIFQCGQCECRFKDWSVMARHWEARHELEDVIPCGMCMETFQEASDVSRHWTKVHGNPQCRFFCPWCQVGFRDYRHWTDHIHNHADEFKCPDCEASFYRLGGLIWHRRTHHNMLDDSLVWIGARHEHSEENDSLTNGTDEELYNFSNNQQSKVNDYLGDEVQFSPLFTKQIDNNENPATCKLCKKSYVKEKFLLKHMKIHEDPDRKFHKCGHCEMSFLNKRDLQMHRSDKHLISCTLCRAKIYGVENLIAHQREEHGLHQSALSKDTNPSQTTCNSSDVNEKISNCNGRIKSAKKLSNETSLLFNKQSFIKKINNSNNNNQQKAIDHSKRGNHLNESKESPDIDCGSNLFTCVHCGNRFKTNGELYEHVQREHYCEQCHKQVRRLPSHRLFPCTNQIVKSKRKSKV